MAESIDPHGDSAPLVWLLPLLAAAALILTFMGLVYGFQIEPTEQGIREAAKGQWVGIPAVVAVLLAIGALFLRRRRTALLVLTAVSGALVLMSLAALAVVHT